MVYISVGLRESFDLLKGAANTVKKLYDMKEKYQPVEEPDPYLIWLNEEIAKLDSAYKEWNTSYSDIMDRGASQKLKVARDKYISLHTK